MIQQQHVFLIACLLLLSIVAVAIYLLLDKLILCTAPLLPEHHNDASQLTASCATCFRSSIISDNSTARLRSSQYSGKVLYSHFHSLHEVYASRSSSNATVAAAESLRCSRWAVVSTINAPTAGIKVFNQIKSWCLLIIADSASPLDYDINAGLEDEDERIANVVYLSLKRQHELARVIPLFKLLPFNHLGRKNLGYVYAIWHGARYIWDFEDDVMILSRFRTKLHPPGLDGDEAVNSSKTQQGSYEVHVPKGSYNADVFNPFPVFGASHNPSWPRGFPVDRVLSNSSSSSSPHSHAHYRPPQIELVVAAIPVETIAVVQYLANHDPDVDSIYRLTRPLPLDFPLYGVPPLIMPIYTVHANAPLGNDSQLHDGFPAIVPGHRGTVYAPYNAQSTMHMYCSMWALFLPVSPHLRVTDIWRSLIAQRLFSDIGVRIVIHPPIVTHTVQEGRAEEYVDDMLNEMPLFVETRPLVQFLRSWEGRSTVLPGLMEELFICLFERGFLSASDVSLMQAWIGTLIDVGYQFPSLRHSR